MSVVSSGDKARCYEIRSLKVKEVGMDKESVDWKSEGGVLLTDQIGIGRAGLG